MIRAWPVVGALVVLVACGSKPPATVDPTLPPITNTPTAPISPTVIWSELHGTIEKVAVEGVDDSLGREITAVFADQTGKPLDRSALRERLGQTMRLGGVWTVGLRGVQLTTGIKLILAVKPPPKLRRLTAYEGTKEVALTGIAQAAVGMTLDPSRIDQIADRLRSRIQTEGREVVVEWKQVPMKDGDGVEVILQVTTP